MGIMINPSRLLVSPMQPGLERLGYRNATNRTCFIGQAIKIQNSKVGSLGKDLQLVAFRALKTLNP